MGKVLSRVKRPFQNFNLESRVHKIISQEKPVPAPKYESVQLEIERLMKDNPEEFQEMVKKNEILDKHLKNVYVTSKSEILKPSGSTNVVKPLPLNRSSYEDPVFGIVEPENVPKGRVTLPNALQFITNHHANAAKCSVGHICEKYVLPEETVRNILKYCRTFEVYVPQNKNTKAKYAGPSIRRIKVVTRKFKEINSGEPKTEK
ncbi:hypothetical protein WA026_005781 [Henosepilachna vigintioctopunctata]|uniref:Protein NDUFAF4 homolog n=1 Tax=Henosepilachna vigintioctopunctata TaxID=420089 RepID=A0AAW1U4Y7_9CUCU